ncbi:virulence factor BrkB family protein [Actinobacillus arthritidis]|uniref:virulence factor BrkB family protein n=1 Tax=Actinobacillus arthritidis TaxID=157339 RepID=UPI002441B8ED|nr:virulence factor BrkB family protein [Actinobacillus arthritidis]WGE88931.1 virulence factor BrkB family protein [Actinobacillus arthritidis]
MFLSLPLFLKLLLKRWKIHNIPVSAGYLTYSTTLAIVPLVMVVFSIFTAFPLFQEATEQLKTLIYDNFAPNAGDMVEEYIDLFVANSKKMGIVSTIGLVVVALMLIKSIDETLNKMWRNHRKRSIFISFLLYAVILFIAPLLAGGSIAISSYVFSMAIFNGEGLLSFSQYLLQYAPFVLIWLLFTSVYWLVPNTQVNIFHAMIGAIIAAIFFTLGKQAFIWYITTFPSYQAIYGALAVLPIMLLWIHLSWQVVLIGGLITSTLNVYSEMKKGKLNL